MSGAEESAARRQWEQDVMRRAFEAADAREAEETRKQDAARLDGADWKHDRDVDVFRMAMTGEPFKTHDSIMYDAMTAPDIQWARNPLAERGSKDNPVLLFGDPSTAQRSQPTELDQLLDRAHAITGDREMERRESAAARSRRYAEYLRRQGLDLSARLMAPGDGEITRVVTADGMGQLGTLYGEIVR